MDIWINRAFLLGGGGVSPPRPPGIASLGPSYASLLRSSSQPESYKGIKRREAYEGVRVKRARRVRGIPPGTLDLLINRSVRELYLTQIPG
jgi:hypothetical protein